MNVVFMPSAGTNRNRCSWLLMSLSEKAYDGIGNGDVDDDMDDNDE